LCSGLIREKSLSPDSHSKAIMTLSQSLTENLEIDQFGKLCGGVILRYRSGFGYYSRKVLKLRNSGSSV